MNPRVLFATLLMPFALVAHLAAQSTPPKPVATPSPVYPAELIVSGESGRAMIELTVAVDGSVADPVLKSADHPAFGEAAMTAVRAWKFEPATQDGKPVARRVNLPIIFNMPIEDRINAALKREVFRQIEEPVLTAEEFGKAPRAFAQPAAPYPRTLKGSGVVGTVEVKFVIGPDGRPLNPSIVGDPRAEFVLPAVFAVAHAAYEAPSKDGKNVYVETTVKIEFRENP